MKGAQKYSAYMGSIISTKVTGSPQILMKLIETCIKGEKVGLFNFTSGEKTFSANYAKTRQKIKKDQTDDPHKCGVSGHLLFVAF